MDGFSRAAELIRELSGFLLLAFGRKLSRNLLRHSFYRSGNFRRQLLSHAKLIALNAEHGDPLR